MKYTSTIASTLLTAVLCGLSLSGCSDDSTQSQNKQKAQDTKEHAHDVKNEVEDKAETETLEIDNDQLVKTLQKNLDISGIQAVITSAVPIKPEGLYWVNAEGMSPFMTNKSGTYIIDGTLIEVGGEEPINLTAKFTEKVAKEKLAEVKKDDMVIYPAKDKTKGIIYAFTDSTCPYCQKLHDDIDQINAKGIEVRYLAWPRNQQGLPVLEAVWCSEDKNKAMDIAKSGDMPDAEECESPVKDQAKLGFSLGVKGTPAIYTAEGKQIGGYLPPDDIASALGL